MKKIVSLAAFACVFFSCEKKDSTVTAEHATETTTQQVTTDAPMATPAVESQEDLKRAAQSKPLTNVTLDASHHAFGKVKKGETVHHDYIITNTGENPLIISSVKPGCGCTAPEYTKEPILPGKTGKIKLSFDSSSFEGMQNKQAEVYANVERTPIVLTFSADVQP